MKKALLLTTFFCALFAANSHAAPSTHYFTNTKDSLQLPSSSDIQITGTRSRVLPAFDGSKTVPLELPAGYLTYQWIDANTGFIVSLFRTFSAPVGQYFGIMTDVTGTQVRSSVFTVVSATGPQKPDDAKNLNAILSSPSSIKLTWDITPATKDKKAKKDKDGPGQVSAPADSVVSEIYRSTTPGSRYVLIYITAGDTGEFTDFNVASNTTYFYRVRNVNGGGAAAVSKEVNATTSSDNVPPSVPVNLKVVQTDQTSIELNWDNSTDNVKVTKYYVYVNGVKTDSTANSDYTINNLLQSNRYTINITAADAAGNESAFSTGLVATTGADIKAPTPPVSLKANVYSTSVDLSWGAATDNVGVTRYDVYVNGMRVDSTNSTAYTANNLQVNTPYIFTITAVDLAGNTSLFSNAAIIKTLPDFSAPTVPGNLNVVSANITALTIGWGKSTDNVGVTGYVVYVNGTKAGLTAGTSFTVAKLSPNTPYNFTVSAFDLAGNTSQLSSAFTAYTMPDTIAPAAPARLAVINATISTITVNWDNSTDNIGVSKYYISLFGSVIDSTTASSYTVDSLNVNTMYPIAVTAVDMAGNISASSETLMASTLADRIAPSVPANLKMINATENAVVLSWDNATDNVGVTRYDVYLNGSKLDTTITPGYTVKNLFPGSAYAITISAADAAGNISANSKVLQAKTQADQTAPTIPANIKVNNVTTNSINVSWDISTDNVGVTRYDIYAGSSKIGSSITNTYTIDKLNINTTYSIKVSASDLAGNTSGFSDVAIASTQADNIAPSTPANLKATNITMNSLQASWDNSSDNVGVNRYYVYLDDVLTDSTATASYKVVNLGSNKSYVITVKAADLAGNVSPLSAPVTVKTIGDVVAPSTPGNLKIVSSTATSVVLDWDDASDNVGVTGYDIYVNGSKLYSSQTSAYTANGLAANTTYTFAVKATDLAGNASALSNQVSSSVQPAGLKYKYYEGTWSALPNFSALTPVKTGTTPNIDLSVRKAHDNYAFVWEGYIKITTPGVYTFGTLSDAGSKVYFNTQYAPNASALVNNDGLHCLQSATGTVTIKTAGVYPIAITFFQRVGGAAMYLYYKGPGINWQLVPNSAFSDTNTPCTLASFISNILNNGYFGAQKGTEVSVVANEELKQTVTGMKVYPSPFTDAVNINFTNNVSNGKAQINMYTVAGKLVASQDAVNLSEGENTVSLQTAGRDLAPGIYFVKLVLNGVLIKTFQVIKSAR